jgi:hypothetical protein
LDQLGDVAGEQFRQRDVRHSNNSVSALKVVAI